MKAFRAVQMRLWSAIGVRVIAVALAVPVLVLVSGCAGMTAYQAEQARWQALADRATAHWRVGSVRVELMGRATTGRYVRWDSKVELGTDSGREGMTWLLAHELSHHLLGHTSVWLAQEMEANARAVEVLMVWGFSEADAVALVKRRLLLIQRSGSTLTGKGHDWCAEYHDVARRYPGQPDLRKPGECGA